MSRKPSSLWAMTEERSERPAVPAGVVPDGTKAGRAGALGVLRSVACSEDLRPEYRVRLTRWKEETKRPDTTGEGRCTYPVVSALRCRQTPLFMRGGSRESGSGGVVVAPKPCGTSWCTDCGSSNRRATLSGVETYDPPADERWYMLRLTMPERVKTREGVREFGNLVQRWMRSATRTDHGRPWASAAWMVLEVVPKPEEQGRGVPCPCSFGTGRRTRSVREALAAALAGDDGPGNLHADILADELQVLEETAEGLRWVDGKCSVCRGAGMVPVCHVHAHVVVTARAFWWGADLDMESAAAGAMLEGKTETALALRRGAYRPCPGGGGFVAWARSFGLGNVHVDEVRGGRAGAAAYLGKVCDYAGKLVDGGKLEQFARALGLLTGQEPDEEVRSAVLTEARRAWGFTHGATFDGVRTARTAGAAGGRRVSTRDGLVTGAVEREEAEQANKARAARERVAAGNCGRCGRRACSCRSRDVPDELRGVRPSVDLSSLKDEAVRELRPRVVVETERFTSHENLWFPKRDKLPPGEGAGPEARPEAGGVGGVVLRGVGGWWLAAAGNGRGTVTRDGGSLHAWLDAVVPAGIPVVWLDGLTGEVLTDQEQPL